MAESVTYDTRICPLPHFPGMHYMEVPAWVLEQLGGKINMRLICTVNNAVKFQCGTPGLGNGSGYISINKKRMKELGAVAGTTVQLSITPDHDKYGLPMPEELEELLNQDDEGRRRFEMLTAGKQRNILHYVGLVKSSQLRIDRALLLIGNLKTLPPGKENMRDLLGLPPR